MAEQSLYLQLQRRYGRQLAQLPSSLDPERLHPVGCREPVHADLDMAASPARAAQTCHSPHDQPARDSKRGAPLVLNPYSKG